MLVLAREEIMTTNMLGAIWVQIGIGCNSSSVTCVCRATDCWVRIGISYIFYTFLHSVTCAETKEPGCRGVNRVQPLTCCLILQTPQEIPVTNVSYVGQRNARRQVHELVLAGTCMHRE